MNMSEANAVSRVLSAVINGQHTRDDILEVAEFLAARSEKALMAGIRPSDVRDRWPRQDTP